MAPNEAIVEFESAVHNDRGFPVILIETPILATYMFTRPCRLMPRLWYDSYRPRCYRYAQGEPYTPLGFEVQLAQPLDFMR